MEIPYFATHPNDLVVAPIPDDPLGRANVLALVRGTGTRTVLLSGHFDTVPVDDYGPLKDLAGSAEQLLPRLVEALEASGEDPRALDDFMSGDFLPGRGLLDMKSGIAAGIAVVEAFAADPARRGNLLFAATPDEEDRSVGMRAAAELLLFFSGSAASRFRSPSISMRSATTGMVRRAASSPSAASASSC